MKKIVFSSLYKKSYWTRGRVLLLALIFTFTTIFPATAFADRFDEQIEAAQQEADKFQAEANKLREQANSLQATLDLLTAEKNVIQEKINANETKKQKITADIAQTEQDIVKNQGVLSSTLAGLYVDGSLSPLEILASSSSIGDYVDKQEYRTVVREQIQSAIKRIKELRATLAKQKVEVEDVLKQQNLQRDQVAAKEAERQRLLDQTRGQESVYAQLASNRKTEIESLRAQQAAAMAAAAKARGGGGPDYSGYSSYPFNDSSMDYNDNCQYYSGGSSADPWGYCKRQCTSYVAWKLAKDGKTGFSGMGNANNWAAYGSGVNFRSAQKGDVLVWFVGSYGHVMYVDAVTDSGLAISQYNVPYDSGRYSTDFFSWGDLEGGAYELRRF